MCRLRSWGFQKGGFCEGGNPKHLLGQIFPSKGKLGGFSLRGKIFPLRDNFPLKAAFSFPWNALFSQEMKGLGKRDFYGLRENFDFPPRGKIYLKPFFCLKKNRCYGKFSIIGVCARTGCNNYILRFLCGSSLLNRKVRDLHRDVMRD